MKSLRAIWGVVRAFQGMRRSRATLHHTHGALLDVGVQELRAERDVLRAIQDLVPAISTDETNTKLQRVIESMLFAKQAP